MGIFLIYILISLLMLYIQCRLYWKDVIDEQNINTSLYKSFEETNAFWKIIGNSFFWFITYPFKFIKWVFVDEYLKDIKV